jgi:ankyrin repeat protein
LAAAEGKIQVVDFLLLRGADPDSRDSTGMTPLMHAAVDGHANVMECMLARGAKRDLESIESMSAFDYACLNGHEAAALAVRPAVVHLDKVFRGRALADWIRKHRMYLLL